MNDDTSVALDGAPRQPPAAAFASPELEYRDGDGGGAGEAEAGPAAAASAGSVAASLDEPGRLGYVPCYRTFQDKWFWKDKPWDLAHLFMEMLMRANRKARRVRSGGRLVEIGRGMLATSFSKLSVDTGRDRKTVRRWLKLLGDDGELSVKNMGQNGVVITMLNYEAYALDGGRDGRPVDRSAGNGTDGAVRRRRAASWTAAGQPQGHTTRMEQGKEGDK